MAIGQFVRKLFGPYERQVTDAYRRIFVDVDAYITNILDWVPSAEKILEVGCGEGAITERLAAAYPSATIIGIDIAPNAGRLYSGRANGVLFRQQSVQDFASTTTDKFDLIVLSDVIHHVPEAHRNDIFDTICDLIAEGGSFAFKDWERNITPIHWLGYSADRWITGDRISYMTREEMLDRLTRTFGISAIVDERRVPPWRNNISILVRPGA